MDSLVYLRLLSDLLVGSFYISMVCEVFVHFLYSVQNLAPAVSAEKPEEVPVALDSALQEQERIITMSYALASEASLKSKLVAGWSLI